MGGKEDKNGERREQGGEEREDWRDGYRVTLNMASQLWSLLAAIFFPALPL